MKGIVDEGEEVAVIYIDGKPSAKYAKKHEAERDAEFMRSRHPNKKIEIKHEVRETEAKKGADGKRCWKGKRYAGTENGKDKCIPVKEGDVVPFKKKTDRDKYNTAIAKQRGPLPISRIDPDSAITVKSRRPGDPIEIPDEYQDINLKSKVRGVPKQNQTNFEVWGNNHGYYVFGNNTNAVLSAWPNGEMMVLSDPNDSKGRENCMLFAKQAMKPIELDSLRPKLKNKILQKMSMIDQSAKNEAANPAQQAAIAINMKKKGKKPANEGVIVGHDANDPEVAILGGAGRMSLSRLKKKAHAEALQLADDIANGKYNASSYNMKQLHNTLNTIVAAEKEMEKLYFGEDYTGEFAAEKTPAINPYGGLKDTQHRGAISETPTDNPTGASGEGGWRKYKPKSAGNIGEAKKSEFRLKAEQQQLKQLEKINNSTLPHWAKEYLTLLTDPKGKVFKAAYYSFGKGQDARKEAAEYIMQKYKIPQEWIDKINFLKGSHVTKNREEDRHFNWDMPSMHEDTAYAGGMGQGGNAGESYRKFTPKSAGTYKESSIMKGLRK